MNMELKAPLRAQKSKVEIVDCDFHPKITLEQLRPHLSERWWQRGQIATGPISHTGTTQCSRHSVHAGRRP